MVKKKRMNEWNKKELREKKEGQRKRGRGVGKEE